MSSWSPFTNPGPYHVVVYGTFLGSQIFNTFINAIVSFNSLPRPQFSQLQTKLFPIYFLMQVAFPVVLVFTYPGSRLIPSSLGGVLDPSNRYTVLAPLALTSITAVSNMFVLGPATMRVMKERKAQETRDGKRSYDAGPHSPEMQKLNKRFGIIHGASSVTNLLTIVGTIAYGIGLGNRL